MHVCLVHVDAGISVRVVRAPMPAEQLLSVLFDLKSLASQLLASGPAPASSPKTVAATEDVVVAGVCVLEPRSCPITLSQPPRTPSLPVVEYAHAFLHREFPFCTQQSLGQRSSACGKDWRRAH